MATETKRIDDASIPLATDLQGVTIPVMQGGVSKRLMAEQLIMQGIAYGVEWDLAVSNPLMTRIGDRALHQSLPIQNKMRRCLLKDDGTVNYYLDANNSALKENGTAANLTGVDGQVMVEIPKHYRRFDFSGTKWKCWISEVQLSGFHEVPKMYISAYQATVDRTSTPKLASVVNTTAAFRGGNNNAAWDAESRTLLGRPATVLSLTNFRTYARNRGTAGKNGAGWNCFLYEANKAMFWLYMVEYANRNSQAPFNAATDANGFKQGGLGQGVTDLNGTKWGAFNNYYPFVPMGYTNGLGNRTGVVGYTMPPEYDSVPFTTYVPSYRGIENPFGHINHWIDGVKVRVQASDAGGRSILYTNSNPATMQDNDYANYREIGDIARTDGFIKRLILGEFGDIVQAESGAGSTTYWCDYGYNGNLPATGESQRGLLWGGFSFSGASAGLAFSYSDSVPSATTTLGSRLVFLPS